MVTYTTSYHSNGNVQLKLQSEINNCITVFSTSINFRIRVAKLILFQIECDEGFEKNPKVDLECINSGEDAYFNDKIPVCEQVKIKCNRPVIKNGYINGPDVSQTTVFLILYKTIL